MRISHFIVIFISIIWISCKHTANNGALRSDVAEDISIANITVSDSLLIYDKTASLWYLNDTLFSGYAVSHYANEQLKDKVGFLDGRKQNQSLQWYADGHLKESSHYQDGKLNGEKKRWSADSTHILIAQLHYKHGKAHGEQKLWYPTGELYKKLQLNMGREEGIQQAFRKNGALYANYEAKAGRIFGLKKAALCFGLEEENVRYEN